MSEKSPPKGKQLRKRAKKKVMSLQDSIDALFKRLLKNGYPLVEQLKEEKFHILLKRVENERVTCALANALAQTKEESLVRGTVESVFKASSPLKCLVTLKDASFSNGNQGTVTFLGFRAGEIVQLVGANGNTYGFRPNRIVYGRGIEVVELPADLRKWKSNWAQVYLNVSMGSRLTHSKYNKGSSKDAILGGVGKLHQIRRINKDPSKKQLQVSKQSKNKTTFDMAGTGLSSVSSPNF